MYLPDGKELGLTLISEGLCEDFSHLYPHPRQAEYLKAQSQAKKAKKGLWKARKK